MKLPKLPAPAPGSVGKVVALTDATRAKDIPGYDPTGGRGWDRFLEKHLKLSLPPDRLGGSATVVRYEILKQLPENVRTGEIAPGFEQPGLGTQYHFPDGIKKLAMGRYLKEIP